MGNPLKLRTAKTLHRRLMDQKDRFDQVFGDYEAGTDTGSGNVQRALESALDQTEALIGWLTPKPQ